jgi:hypothetical protein
LIACRPTASEDGRRAKTVAAVRKRRVAGGMPRHARGASPGGRRRTSRRLRASSTASEASLTFFGFLIDSETSIALSAQPRSYEKAILQTAIAKRRRKSGPTPSDGAGQKGSNDDTLTPLDHRRPPRGRSIPLWTRRARKTRAPPAAPLLRRQASLAVVSGARGRRLPAHCCDKTPACVVYDRAR